MTFDYLSDYEKVLVQQEITEFYPDGISETALNDILWFEDGFIEGVIGRKLFEHEEEDGKDN